MRGAGFYYAPTVLSDVPPEARILHEEPFGPVLTVAPFVTIDDALAEANRLPYGLAGFAFTRSAALGHAIARRLECGTVGINHFGVSTHGLPFGGVKESGYGREGGVEGVLGYTYAKTVTHLMT